METRSNPPAPWTRTALLAVLAVAICTTPVQAQEAETIDAWETYAERTEARIARELAPGRNAFFTSEFESSPEQWQSALDGDIPIESMETAGSDGEPIDVPSGLIHHWRGAVFIPGVTLAEVLEAVQRPERDTHQTDVLETRVLERRTDYVRVYMKLVRSKIVTATYNTEHEALYTRHDSGRASSRTVATHIAELDDAGTPNEREKAPGEDRGFLWRLNSYWRYAEVDGGVMVECESVSLSRSIPFLVRPIVGRIINGIAEESLQRVLVGIQARFATK